MSTIKNINNIIETLDKRIAIVKSQQATLNAKLEELAKLNESIQEVIDKNLLLLEPEESLIVFPMYNTVKRPEVKEIYGVEEDSIIIDKIKSPKLTIQQIRDKFVTSSTHRKVCNDTTNKEYPDFSENIAFGLPD